MDSNRLSSLLGKLPVNFARHDPYLTGNEKGAPSQQLQREFGLRILQSGFGGF
jgi:hypothetical protein